MKRTLEAYLNRRRTRGETISEEQILEAAHEIWLLFVESYRSEYGEDSVWDFIGNSVNKDEIADIIRRKIVDFLINDDKINS